MNAAVRATARLQFHAGFTLDDACAIVPYLASLGISHLYASPLLAARPGSTHGYDTIDYQRINPELGGEDALRRLVDRLHAHGLGLIVDIVPNHMAADTRNPWWADVLRHGPDSAHAACFDIDWAPEEKTLSNRVLLPVLGTPYGEALDSGELELVERDGHYHIRYYDDLFPVDPGTDPRSFLGPDAQPLHALLERQSYRLAFWRTAADIINWRRFFDITGLVGTGTERPDVFDAIHETVLSLHHDGLIDGFRVDHVDGLAKPGAYCRRLRSRLMEGAPLYVEKILHHGEALRDDWRTDGTTGYDFLDLVCGVLHDPAGETALTGLWSAVSGRAVDFKTVQQTARDQILDTAFTAEFAALARTLHDAGQATLASRDLTRAALGRGLRAILVQFPVYRTYFSDTDPAPGATEHAVLAQACADARDSTPQSVHAAIDWIAAFLGSTDGPSMAERRKARVQFEHLTAPLTAKSVEDTGFYRYGRLLSRNDVGCDPGRLSFDVATFHDAVGQRAGHFPRAMLATATHDHKRGEDARMRLAVLSEPAAEWAVEVTRWSALNAHLRLDPHTGASVPDLADELMLYQSMLGAWPMDTPTDTDLTALHERLDAWQTKALREAKRHTSWTEPNEAYEGGCARFLKALLDPSQPALFRDALDRYVGTIAPAGALNALSQTLLRLTVPGIPDLYQGTDLWDLSLVDPDNRRPVDYALREKTLSDERDFQALASCWRTGAIKQRLVRQLLRHRSARPDLFTTGTYEPLPVDGPMADHLIAFLRRRGDDALVVLAPRLAWGLRPSPADLSVLQTGWAGTRVTLPPDLRGASWRDVIDPAFAPDLSADVRDLDGRVPLAALATSVVR
ncbi:1,4-alpha-D-glucan 1-alpha-D-glucosylmutase [Ameyamaea chiangmaiensis NBRC 103196]|uniref:Malto-oligosyltrehalose synthase n=1 Tax=Ameyamaea chiangmaiensis TaxID=442969 RepID=A0A850P8U0_9PROT|nr:malto-oligosyltrehalose synthase [Ameyamaea chiangmaiensis]MBS4074693.1 malto-oligosyltrehalose synthase [Ameyamaea chiangmaiensis]NVN40404.1 malto-oligosyltrehalose synthase [Ameyamaea chiangmaiensis]GBQ62385.1 1,4-alpha-D-glucan 1-alpha-D-glucosylmutase [Ameyamaea chiangmaiensis NBRC 103196]